jgi:hypothetical protein
MFVFTPGLPQRVAMIPDPDDQGTQPQWTMIIVGKWFLVYSEMLGLITKEQFWKYYKHPQNHQSLLRMDQSNYTEHKEPSPGCWQIMMVLRGLGVADP